MKRYCKLQTCSLVILYSISANSTSKQQGGRHIVIGAMGSADRVITLGGGGGGVGNRRPGSCIYIYLYVYVFRWNIYRSKAEPKFPLWLGSFLKPPIIIVVEDYCWANDKI